MNGNPTINNSICVTVLKTLYLVESGLIIKNKNKEEKKILFSEVFKIYIKKDKFSFLDKIKYLSISLVLLSIFAKFLPLEPVLLATVILFIALIVKMNTYKWYQLVFHLDNGTSYTKVFYSSTKQEHINIVNIVRKRYRDYSIESNFKVDNTPQVNTEEKEFAFSYLRIV